MRHLTLVVALGCWVALGAGGCGDDDGTMPMVDAGADAGALDSGGRDAGPGVDAGPRTDAGVVIDAGVDAGDVDAGELDAGDLDAGPGTDAGIAMDAGAAVDAGAAMDAGTDAGIAMDAGVAPTDAGTFGTADAGPTTVIMTGWLFGADATERDPDAGATGFDGGVPDGSAPTPGGRLYNAAVIIRDVATGAVFSRTRSDARGFYSLVVPASTVVFQEIEPVGPYLGIIRGERTGGTDYEAYDIYVPLRSGAEATAAAIPVTYDATRGVIAVGFNPLTPNLGGEGFDIGAGPAHAPPANLTPTGVILTNILPPLCSALDGGTVTTDGGVPCTTMARSDQIHVLNTDLGFVTITPISPPGGTCEIRFMPSHWLVRPDTYTVVNIDCF